MLVSISPAAPGMEGQMMDIHIGDRIKFRVALRDGVKTATRRVTGFHLGNPEVSFWSYRGFVVRRAEVIEIIADAPRAA